MKNRYILQEAVPEELLRLRRLFITDNNNDSIRVIWYNSYETGTITACITNENGISCKKMLQVKIN